MKVSAIWPWFKGMLFILPVLAVTGLALWELAQETPEQAATGQANELPLLAREEGERQLNESWPVERSSPRLEKTESLPRTLLLGQAVIRRLSRSWSEIMAESLFATAAQGGTYRAEGRVIQAEVVRLVEAPLGSATGGENDGAATQPAGPAGAGGQQSQIVVQGASGHDPQEHHDRDDERDDDGYDDEDDGHHGGDHDDEDHDEDHDDEEDCDSSGPGNPCDDD